MDSKIQIQPTGIIKTGPEGFLICLEKEFIPALTNIDGFSHLQIIWWGNLFDNPQYRATVVTEKPYKKGPGKLGIFATRSPVRPNPILITNIMVTRIDMDKGIIYTPYIDAEDGTPVLDIKPYHLEERIRDCRVPGWCGHWPKWYEESATFDWSNEFNF